MWKELTNFILCQGLACTELYLHVPPDVIRNPYTKLKVSSVGIHGLTK
jgi:hypothetical protein